MRSSGGGKGAARAGEERNVIFLSAERRGWGRERNAEALHLYCFIYDVRYKIGFTLSSASVYQQSQHNPGRNQRKPAIDPSAFLILCGNSLILLPGLVPTADKVETRASLTTFTRPSLKISSWN